MNILILGNSEILLLFRYLRHFLINIDILEDYDGSDLSKYELVITDNTNLKNLENNQIKLIFNVVEKLDKLSTKKNLVNLFLTFDYKNLKKDLISQFIDNPKVDISIFGENNEIYQTITIGITFHGNG